MDKIDKNKLINVDKNEAYKNFIDSDGLEESNKILKNMVIYLKFRQNKNNWKKRFLKYQNLLLKQKQ